MTLLKIFWSWKADLPRAS